MEVNTNNTEKYTEGERELIERIICDEFWYQLGDKSIGYVVDVIIRFSREE